jgi:RNA polymerase sigma factor (sigma-70 family)
MDQTQLTTDAEALASVIAGNEEAFHTLYRRHGPAVVRLAWALAPSQTAVEEVVQDTFVTLWERAKSISIVDSSVLPWLLVTCRNHCRNQRRKNARWSGVILTGEVEDLGASTATPSELRWVADAIDQLPPRDREVCQLCLVEGHTYASAAAQIGVTSSTVGKRLERAKVQLRKALS